MTELHEPTVRKIVERLREMKTNVSAKIIEMEYVRGWLKHDEPTEMQQYVEGVRQYLAWLEDNQDMDRVDDFKLDTKYSPKYIFCSDKQEMAEVVRAAPGRVEKGFDNSHFNASFNIGGVHFMAFTSRDNVCEKIVTGQKEVRTMVPAPDAEMIEQITYVDEFEWSCVEPLLASAT